MDPSRLRAAVAAVWAHRAATEREAAGRFLRLAVRMEEAGMGAELVAWARRAADDERRHIEQCAATARHFGGEVAVGEEVEVSEIAPAALPLIGRVLYEAVAFCCIAETANVALLTVTLKHVRDEVVRRTTREVLADEIGHARLGWACLAASRGRTDFLGDLVPRMLEGSITDEIFLPSEPDEEAAPLLEHGNLPRAMRLDLFRAALDDIVLPGLDVHGVRTAPARAWVRDRLGHGDRITR